MRLRQHTVGPVCVRREREKCIVIRNDGGTLEPNFTEHDYRGHGSVWKVSFGFYVLLM